MAGLPVILDINYKEIKGLSFKSNFAGQMLKDAHKAAVSNESPEKNMQGILAFIKKHYPESNTVYLNIPYENVYIRELTLPFDDQKKVKEILPFELESLMSFELDELVFDYYSYPDFEKSESHIVVLATNKRPLIPYLAFFKHNNIQVAGLYAPIDALFHLYSYTNESSLVMVHISAITTMLVVIEDHKWVFARTLPMGYDVLVHWLSQKTRSSFVESHDLLMSLPSILDDLDTEFFKNEYQINQSRAKIILQTLELFGEKLSSEINLSLQSTRFLNEEVDVEKLPVFVSSDLSNQRILENLVGRYLNKTVRSFPFEKTPLATIPKDYALALGSAQLNGSAKGLNFLQGDLKKLSSIRKSKERMPFYIMAGLGVIFFISAFIISFSQKSEYIAKLEKENENLVRRYFRNKTIDPNISMVSNANKWLTKAKKESEVFIKFLRSPKLRRVLIELNNLLPNDGDTIIEIDNLVYKPEEVRFNAETSSLAMLDSLVSSIEKSPYFKEVQKNNVRSAPAKGGKTTVKFQLVITVVEVDPVWQ